MTIREIRQKFYALRNGLLADTLRKGGISHEIIFGLNVPQLSEIAREVKASSSAEDAETMNLLALGRELWADRKSRESRLLACWLIPAGEISGEEAMEMMKDVMTREEADILAFRLLRYHPQAREIAEKAPAGYAREALLRNLASL